MKNIKKYLEEYKKIYLFKFLFFASLLFIITGIIIRVPFIKNKQLFCTINNICLGNALSAIGYILLSLLGLYVYWKILKEYKRKEVLILLLSIGFLITPLFYITGLKKYRLFLTLSLIVIYFLWLRPEEKKKRGQGDFFK